MVVARSEEMQLVAYALARCGVKDPEGGSGGPPPWLGTPIWREAYALFFPRLGDGRDPKSFENSLKNARDAFDAHVPSDRIGWVDRSGAPRRQDDMVGRILARWGARSDAEVRDAVLMILHGALQDQQDETDEESARTEGGARVYLARRHERDPALRREAIRIHGTACMACEFDFHSAYGPHGEGYIEVHHAVPLAEHGVRQTDPTRDLLVLCANCHRMVHRKRGICLSLDELKSKLAGLWSAGS